MNLHLGVFTRAKCGDIILDAVKNVFLVISENNKIKLLIPS